MAYLHIYCLYSYHAMAYSGVLTKYMYLQITQTKQISRPIDPARILSRGPDFTPSYADFGRQPQSGRVAAVSYIYPKADSDDYCC